MNPFPCFAFRGLVEHLLRANLIDILSKSKLHCHAKHVHSVVLLDSPGRSIRLFVAEPGNELHRNVPGFHGNANDRMSVGFHAHHCELTLTCLRGGFFNWIVRPDIEAFDIIVDAYRYRSVLRGENPRLRKDRAGATRHRQHHERRRG